MTVTLNLSQFDLLWAFLSGKSWVPIKSQFAHINIDNYEISDIYSCLCKFCKNLRIIFSNRSECRMHWLIFGLTLINHSCQNYISVWIIFITTDVVHVNLSKWEFSKNVFETKCKNCWKILNIFEYFEFDTARFART